MTDIIYTFHNTPFGNSLIACTAQALVYMSLRPQVHQTLSWFKQVGYHPIEEENKITKKAVRELEQYFSGNRKTFTVPFKLHGTDFQNKVWTRLKDVPFGQLVSYGELAAMAGHPRAARAVGTTMARNRIPIIIPCHRVIPSSRKLGHYTGGVDIKEQLLALEGIHV